MYLTICLLWNNILFWLFVGKFLSGLSHIKNVIVNISYTLMTNAMELHARELPIHENLVFPVGLPNQGAGKSSAVTCMPGVPAGTVKRRGYPHKY